MSRVLKSGNNQITQGYNAKTHQGIDIVKYKGQTEYIVAHTEGEVVEVVKTYNRTDKTGGSYGNYVRIKHPNGYYTLYAHLKYGSVTVSKGQRVSRGQVIGYMGNTGHSFGAHLHFEVRNTSNVRINPTAYINADLPNMSKRTVSYRVYSNVAKRWFNTAKDGQTAGNEKDNIGGIQIRTGSGCGNTYYRAHVINNGWLGEVKKWDDTANGYAGIKGAKIDAFAFKSENGKVSYRCKTAKSGWLPWVSGYNTKDNRNGYAGNIGEPITAIQIKIS